MNFRNTCSTEAISECGEYERKSAWHDRVKANYFNCWHIPTGAHVASGFSAKAISDRCDEHREKFPRGTSEVA